MANDQGKTGQQGGTAPENPGGFENDPVQPSDPGQRGRKMPGEQPDWNSQRDDQGAGQGSGGNRHDQQGGAGGHTTGPKSDDDQSGIDEASQAVQDEDSGMTEDNR